MKGKFFLKDRQRCKHSRCQGRELTEDAEYWGSIILCMFCFCTLSGHCP